RVRNRLLRQAVLQLECGDWQPVDEQRHVEGAVRLVTAVAKLARDAEAVCLVLVGSLCVLRGRRAVEEIEMVRPVFDPMAQAVDYRTLGAFTLQTREELSARWAIRLELQGLDEMLLGRQDEPPQLQEVDAELPVVVPRIAQKPAGAARNGNR